MERRFLRRLLLPALLLATDKLIVHTTMKMKPETERTESV